MVRRHHPLRIDAVQFVPECDTLGRSERAGPEFNTNPALSRLHHDGAGGRAALVIDEHGLDSHRSVILRLRMRGAEVHSAFHAWKPQLAVGGQTSCRLDAAVDLRALQTIAG